MPLYDPIFMQQGMMRSPSLEMTEPMSQVTFLQLFALILCLSSGQEDCDRKDCVCRRMYLTYETFATYWFPILFALGIYCLLDGMFSFVISFMQFFPHTCSMPICYCVYFLSLVFPLLITYLAFYINFVIARIRCGKLSQGQFQIQSNQ